VRILAEILILALGLAAVMVVARGLSPVAPVLAGFLRALFHPLTIALLAALFVLFRLGRSRRGKSAGGPDRETPRRDPRL
jgi:FtsH-binding integral membrane protein